MFFIWSRVVSNYSSLGSWPKTIFYLTVTVYNVFQHVLYIFKALFSDLVVKSSPPQFGGCGSSGWFCKGIAETPKSQSQIALAQEASPFGRSQMAFLTLRRTSCPTQMTAPTMTFYCQDLSFQWSLREPGFLVTERSSLSNPPCPSFP